MAPVPAPKFLFVASNGLHDGQGSNVKRESQKYLTAARQHVMRDISLSRRRTKKPVTISVQLELESKPHKMRRKGSACGDRQRTPDETALPRALRSLIPAALDGSRLDPFVRLPIVATPRMRFLFDHFLTSTCKSIALVRNVAWPLLTLDPGIFYHTLTLSAFCLSARYGDSTGRGSIIAEALGYYAAGLSSVNSRLDDNSQRYSDGVVLSITGSAIYTLSAAGSRGWCWETTNSRNPNCTRPDVDHWALHLSALKTIFDRRGGIDSNEMNSNESSGVLRHWLYLMDLEGAIPRDVQPFFPLPLRGPADIGEITTVRKPAVAACLRQWSHVVSDNAGAIDIFADLDTIVTHLSNRCAEKKHFLQSGIDIDAPWLLPLAHRCLRLSSKAAEAGNFEIETFSNTSPFEEALRHAILLFHALIRRGFGPPAAGMGLHVTELIAALDRCSVHDAAKKLQRLIFWMLVVGAMETCNLGWDASWFFVRIIDGCAILGVQEPEEVETTVQHAMSQFVWLEDALSASLAVTMYQLERFMKSQYA